MYSLYNKNQAPIDYHFFPVLQNYPSNKKLGPMEDCEYRLEFSPITRNAL